jgi:hypothetical protein
MNLRIIREKTINNTTKKERGGGFDSFKVAPRLRSNTKGN